MKGGELVFLGGVGLDRGLGNAHHVTCEPYGASVAALGLSVEFIEAAEARGYARDLCSYLRCGFGSMFLNGGRGNCRTGDRGSH